MQIARTGGAMPKNNHTEVGVVWPVIFIMCLGWTVWFFPRFIVVVGLANDNMNSDYAAAGAIDYAFLAGLCVSLVVGTMKANVTTGEGTLENRFDKLSIFLGRVTMLLIVVLVGVMFYEVVVRYVFEQPTLWANELSLWIAGFIFLLAGLYAMQQRSHIRIFLLYDLMPRPLQNICDVISTALIFVFAFAMIWGSYNEARDKLIRWETFGTAFDPPIPATMKPLILLLIALVAMQALMNLITDWNKKGVTHSVIDETEVEDIIQIQSARSHEQRTHAHEQGQRD